MSQSLREELARVRRLRDSLFGMLCPACGREKIAKHTVCGCCYRQLPSPLQRSLYRRMGEGYEEAVAVALEFLGADKPHWPEPLVIRPSRCQCGHTRSAHCGAVLHGACDHCDCKKYVFSKPETEART